MCDDKWCKYCGQPIPKPLIDSSLSFWIMGIIIGIIDIAVLIAVQVSAANGQCAPDFAARAWFAVPLIGLLIWLVTPAISVVDDSGWAEQDK